jgi:hypothetical protein
MTWLYTWLEIIILEPQQKFVQLTMSHPNRADAIEEKYGAPV